MALPKKLGSIKRFGARYGRRGKHKLAKIESVQRGKHKCPSCRSLKVKRIAVGIWNCEKCKSKFAGKAYSTGSKIVSTKDFEDKDEKVQEIEEKEDLDEEETEQKYSDSFNDKEEPEEDKY